MTLPTTSLYFSDGKSDKEYHAEVVARDGGFVVDFRYGRRGGALQAGCKTAKPVTLEEATKIHGKLVAEKMSKGYTGAETGVAYQGSDKAGRVSGLLPQLLNEVEAHDVERLVNDDDWYGEQKFDGERRLVRRTGDKVVGINRLGLEVPLPKAVEASALAVDNEEFVIDGEIIGDRLYAFDLLSIDGVDVTGKGALARKSMLLVVVDSMNTGVPAHIEAAKMATRADAKRTMLEALRRTSQEGMVFKRASAPYTPGRPNSGGDQLKFKFCKSATVVVTGANGSKRSVAVHGYRASAPGIQVPLGNVTIPANFDIPAPGAIVEVRYLYAYEGGSLFQSVYLGERTDQTLDACTVEQLKFKAGHASVDAVEEPAAASRRLKP